MGIVQKTDKSIPEKTTFVVALAGNPNSGKTTIFNALTGSRQRVGNYGGVTVETREGVLRHGDIRLRIIDLPGTYSLSAYSIEEIVARDFIIQEQPDVVVNVVDGSNLERNLYLSVQLAEMGTKMVVALNMADEMRQKGLRVDLKALGRTLGAPVIPTIGTRRHGIDRLVDNIIAIACGELDALKPARVNYGKDVNAEVEKLAELINAGQADTVARQARQAASSSWVALKLLENDNVLAEKVHRCVTCEAVRDQVHLSRQRLTNLYGDDAETLITEHRYGHAHGIARQVMRRSVRAKIELSDRIDAVLTHRVLGLPIFAVLMYLTFWLVFTLGSPPMEWIKAGTGALSNWVAGQWTAQTLPLVRSLVLDGVIAGVGGVIVFLPNIMLLFLAIALLEDTGYMARAAFLVDRLMKWVGLHGKSFIPMLIGFGCTVPGILGTRVLDNRRDRMTTMLVLPLMSCGARLPIYMLISRAFFTANEAALAVFAMYIVGIVLAIVLAKLMRITIFRGQAAPFVMELPPYRRPTLLSLALHMWQRSWHYLKKAGTIILAISILLWAMMAFPHFTPDPTANLTDKQVAQKQLERSWAGRIGRILEPLTRPLGFDWKINTAMIGAIGAKEVFVSQMGMVYAMGEQEEADSVQLRENLHRDYSPLTGICVMLFCLISAPCMATVAVVRRESGSWAWALGQWIGLTILAYGITLVVYQIGQWLNVGMG
ncbi:MAG: ferrous iron transport protein B [Sedimentisphaerales bacterium]|nr:ferrous iron transport protein B [Sedimentisphaerales bacterium]